MTHTRKVLRVGSQSGILGHNIRSIAVVVAFIVSTTSSAASQDLLSIVKGYEEKYKRKCHKAIIKYADLYLSPCIKSKSELKRRELVVYPVYIFEINRRASEKFVNKGDHDIHSLFSNLSLSKKNQPVFYLSEGDKYFGRLFSTRPGNVWQKSLEVYCDSIIDSGQNDSRREFEIISREKPDLVFIIANTRLDLILYKRNSGFFKLNYFNSSERIFIPINQWVSDLEAKRGLVWQDLIK